MTYPISKPGHECQCIDCARLRGSVVSLPYTSNAAPTLGELLPEPRNRAERRAKKK